VLHAAGGDCWRGKSAACGSASTARTSDGLVRSSDFEGKFQEPWRFGRRVGHSAFSEGGADAERQYGACKQSIDEQWWERVADAVESMLAARAQQVVLEDSAGNRRVQSLVGVLDLMFWIRMTPARARR